MLNAPQRKFALSGPGSLTFHFGCEEQTHGSPTRTTPCGKGLRSFNASGSNGFYSNNTHRYTHRGGRESSECCQCEVGSVLSGAALEHYSTLCCAVRGALTCRTATVRPSPSSMATDSHACDLSACASSDCGILPGSVSQL